MGHRNKKNVICKIKNILWLLLFVPYSAYCAGADEIIKFYNIDFLIYNNPSAIYADTNGIVQKLNTNFLYEANGISSMEPKRFIAGGKQYIFLTVSYPAKYPVFKKEICQNTDDIYLYVARYRFNQLQIENKVPLYECKNNIELVQDTSADTSIAWDASTAEFNLSWADYMSPDEYVQPENQQLNATQTQQPANVAQAQQPVNSTQLDATVNAYTQTNSQNNTLTNTQAANNQAPLKLANPKPNKIPRTGKLFYDDKLQHFTFILN